MSEYSTYFDKLIDNYKNYNLYFAIILLVKLAAKNNIEDCRLYNDISQLQQLIKLELSPYDIKLLDIEDALQIAKDTCIDYYTEQDIIKLLEVL